MTKFKTREYQGRTQIWDRLRHRWLVLTPEERVRQWFIDVLTSNYEVPPTMISQEYGLEVHGRSFRADIVVFDGGMRPAMVVECKAADVELTRETLNQAAHYNLILGVKCVVITNGRQSFCFRCEEGRYIAQDQIPNYTEFLK